MDVSRLSHGTEGRSGNGQAVTMFMIGKNDTARDVMLRGRERAEREGVVLYARQIMQQVPGCTWGEAIRVAENRIAADKR